MQAADRRQLELAVVDAAGHLSNLEQPAAFTAAVAEFVKKLG
ncbi:MAG: hypothetical protein U0736_06655 [Gemmataceae bacterium]